MKAGLLIICLCLMTVLFYSWWRSGTIVMYKSFDGFIIQVREVPHVSDGDIMSSPPGVAQSAFIIEVGGNSPQTTFRIDPTSERYGPTSIIRIGTVNDHEFQVQFSNARRINVRLAHGQVSLAEWFSGDP
jgi:hypothetical protein